MLSGVYQFTLRASCAPLSDELKMVKTHEVPWDKDKRSLHDAEVDSCLLLKVNLRKERIPLRAVTPCLNRYNSRKPNVMKKIDLMHFRTNFSKIPPPPSAVKVISSRRAIGEKKGHGEPAHPLARRATS